MSDTTATQRSPFPAASEEGAVAAAIEYATAPQGWLYLSDTEITEAVSAVATDASRERLVSETTEAMRVAREQLGASPGRVWWLVRPLAWRVLDYHTEAARVAVWVVTVLSAEGVAAPQTEWMTLTVDLAWTHDAGWLVEAVRDAPGPTPMPGPKDQPWEASRFDAGLAGFTRVEGRLQR